MYWRQLRIKVPSYTEKDRESNIISRRIYCMNNEIQRLIDSLEKLQIDQTRLLARLVEARARERARLQVRENATFTVGDRVRIRNPNRLQETHGSITRIGATRITVTTVTGKKIQREPQNLIKEE